MSYINLDNTSSFRLSEEKSITDIFKEYSKIKETEIQKLLNIKRSDGFPVLKLEGDDDDKDIGFIFETIGMLNSYGFDKALNFVKTQGDKINEKSILNTFIFETQAKKFKEDTVNLRTKIKIKTSGIFTCNKCGSKETSYTSKQLRSGDEAETFIVACNNCGHTFKKG